MLGTSVDSNYKVISYRLSAKTSVVGYLGVAEKIFKGLNRILIGIYRDEKNSNFKSEYGFLRNRKLVAKSVKLIKNDS